MSRYPGSPLLGTIKAKSESVDFSEPPELHRDVLLAAIAQPVNRTSGFHPTTVPSAPANADPQCMWLKGGAALAKLEVWAVNTAAAGTVTFDVYAFPARRQNQTGDSPMKYVQGTGRKIATLVATCSGFISQNVHPVTGVAVAATDFYGMSSCAITARIDATIVSVLADATLAECWIQIDTNGFEGLYVEPTATGGGGTVTRVVFSLTRIC